MGEKDGKTAEETAAEATEQQHTRADGDSAEPTPEPGSDKAVTKKAATETNGDSPASEAAQDGAGDTGEQPEKESPATTETIPKEEPASEEPVKGTRETPAESSAKDTEVYRPVDPGPAPKREEEVIPYGSGGSVPLLLITALAVLGGFGLLWYLLPLGRGLISLWHEALGGFSYGHQSGYPLAIWLMQAGGLAADATVQDQVVPFVALYGVALLLCADMARRMFPTGRTITAVTITLALALASPLLMLTPFIDPRAALVACAVIQHVWTTALLSGREASAGGAVAFGLSAGVMLLAGPEGMLVAPVSLLWLLTHKWLFRAEGWLALAIAVLVWAPQLVYNASNDISPLTALAGWYADPLFSHEAARAAALHNLAVANAAVVLLAAFGLLAGVLRGLAPGGNTWRTAGFGAALLIAFTVICWGAGASAATMAALPSALLLTVAVVAAVLARRFASRDPFAAPNHGWRWGLRIVVILLAAVAGYMIYTWQDALFILSPKEPPVRLRSVLQTPADVVAAYGDDCAMAAFELRHLINPAKVRCLKPGALPTDAAQRTVIYGCNSDIAATLHCPTPDNDGLDDWCLCEQLPEPAPVPRIRPVPEPPVTEPLPMQPDTPAVEPAPVPVPEIPAVPEPVQPKPEPKEPPRPATIDI